VRPYQIGTAAAIVLIAAVALFDRRDIFRFVVGTAPGDVGASWYPFWAAGIMGLAAVGIAIRAATTPQPTEGAFTGRESVLAVVRLVVPMILYAASFSVLGFYIATGVYMGFFAWYLGRYKVHWILTTALVTPLLIYLAFEVGFKLLLPKSFLYQLIPGFPL